MTTTGAKKVLFNPQSVKVEKDLIDWVIAFHDASGLAQFNSKKLMEKKLAVGYKPPFGIILKAVVLALDNKEVGKDI